MSCKKRRIAWVHKILTLVKRILDWHHVMLFIQVCEFNHLSVRWLIRFFIYFQEIQLQPPSWGYYQTIVFVNHARMQILCWVYVIIFTGYIIYIFISFARESWNVGTFIYFYKYLYKVYKYCIICHHIWYVVAQDIYRIINLPMFGKIAKTLITFSWYYYVAFQVNFYRFVFATVRPKMKIYDKIHRVG